MCQWVFAWNTEIACALFYLSGIQREFPLQPTAGSGMSCDSPLKSPLTSSPFYPPLTLYLSLPSLLSHPLPRTLHFWLCPTLSVCLSFQGWQYGGTTRSMPKLTNVPVQQGVAVAIRSQMAKLDLFFLCHCTLFFLMLLFYCAHFLILCSPLKYSQGEYINHH